MSDNISVNNLNIAKKLRKLANALRDENDPLVQVEQFSVTPCSIESMSGSKEDLLINAVRAKWRNL